MRNLLYKIDISSLSWCFFCVWVSSVFLFLAFLVPSASKILRDLRVKFFLLLLLLCSLKNIILGPTCFSLWFLIFCCHYLLELLLSFCLFYFSWGLQIFVLPSLSSFFFSSLIFAISSQVLCNFGDMYVHVQEAIRKFNKENSKGNWKQMIKSLWCLSKNVNLFFFLLL